MGTHFVCFSTVPIVVGKNGLGCARWQCAENLSLMKPAPSQLLPSLENAYPAAYTGDDAGFLMVATPPYFLQYSPASFL